MIRAPVATWQIKYGGLVIAAVGFVLTRYTVLESVRPGETLPRFLLGQAPFLVLGLGLTAFGVALAVSTYTAAEVNTVATWCLLGTGSMAAVLGVTYAVPLVFGGSVVISSVRELGANALIAGAVGGVFTGLRSATNRRQRRALVNQADRLTALNRILRHEVLNKLNVIHGYADGDAGGAGLATIRRNAAHIEAAMSDVDSLTRAATRQDEIGGVPLRSVLDEEMSVARTAHPDAVVEARADLPAVTVRADAHLGSIFRHLFDNALRYNDAARAAATVTAETRGTDVAIRIEDNGPGLPREQQALLDGGRLPEYDDPTAGFGLTVSRLLVDLYGGELTADSDDGGTAVTLVLPRAENDGAPLYGEHGVSVSRLRDATVAALVAGVGMGLVLQALFGSIAIIGALYGVASAAVAWLTHLFHSVVFGVVFAAAVWRQPIGRDARGLLRFAAMGTVYGVAVWSVASAFVMPLWLQSAGVPAPVPSLDAISLFGHVVWGALLGGLYAALAG